MANRTDDSVVVDTCESRATALVVDDEPYAVGMLAQMLEPAYRVITATGGEAALERMGPEIDLILLDRRMPDLDGDDVLARIRARGYQTPVVMVTGVEPDLDIIDLPFDAYLVKPVRASEVHSVVETVLDRETYDRTLRELYSLTARLTALEESHTHETLEQSEEYVALKERRNRLATTARGRLGRILANQSDPAVVYRDVLSEFKSCQ